MARSVGPMVVGYGAGAWGGSFVHAPPNGSWNQGSVTIPLCVPDTAYYYVECRILGLTWNNDSFYVRMDSLPELTWGFLGPPDLGWHVEAVIVQGSSPYVFLLSQGTHQVRFRTREPGARLDAVRLVKASVCCPDPLSEAG